MGDHTEKEKDMADKGREIQWGTIALLGVGGVAAYLVLTSASDALASGAELVDEQKSGPEAECSQEATKVADAAVANKSWFKSKTKVFNEAYNQAYNQCMKTK